MKTLHGLALVIMGTLSACSLDPVSRRGNLTIHLAPNPGSDRSMVVKGNGVPTSAPAAVNGFSCLAINVVGPGIPDSSENPEPNIGQLFDKLLRRESYCTYRGILRGPFSSTATTDQEVSLVVPPGSPRIVQVVGLVETAGNSGSHSNDCAREFNPGVPPVLDPLTGQSLEADAFELGRAQVDLFQDQTISIAMDYNSIPTTALKIARSLKCGNGGGGGPSQILVPTDLSLIASPPTDLAMGSDHICAIFSGTVYCKGRNNVGQLGNGTTIDSSTWVATTVTGATKVAAGMGFSCAVYGGGTVACWGAGALGQLGNGANANSPSPVDVSGMSNAVAITAGGYHACARLSGSGVKCWGGNSNGQLGDGTTTSRNAPVAAGAIATATSLSAGFTHTCVQTAGQIQCWGDAAYYQNGLTTQATAPTNTPSTAGAMIVTAGENHACMVTSTAMKCWGRNEVGQLGKGAISAPIDAPSVSAIVIAALTPTLITAGRGYSCSQMNNGAVYCWGNGPQLGSNSNAVSAAPVMIPSTSFPSPVAKFYFGPVSGTVCAGLNDGTVRCWGDNSAHQIL